VAAGFGLEIVAAHDGGGEVRLVHASQPPADGSREVGDEFTLAVFVGRFRSRPLLPPFRASAVRLTRPAPARATRHEALLGAPVAFSCAAAAIAVGAGEWRARLDSADPALQRILRELGERIGLGDAGSDLELAVRARLRALLPEGRAEAAEVARALGVSERTLHRRLNEAGRSFGGVLDAFREAEAERLLSAGVPLGDIALRLGYSDQTAWNRAFRRWKGMAPSRWLRGDGERASRPPRGRGGTSPGRRPPRRR
jgi:AraC-like DNA-binding protein